MTRANYRLALRLRPTPRAKKTFRAVRSARGKNVRGALCEVSPQNAMAFRGDFLE